MPRMDDPKIKKKAFQKESMRSWDRDLFEKLKIKNDSDDESESKKEVDARLRGHDGQVDARLRGHDVPVETVSNKEQVAKKVVKKDSVKKEDVNKLSAQIQKTKKESSVSSQSGFNQGSIRVQKEKGGKNNALLDSEELVAYKISKLSETERRVLLLINDICTDRKCYRTGDILSVQFDMALELKKNSRETAIKRLVKKGLLARNRGKSGINGTLCFSINGTIRNELIRFIASQGKYNLFNTDIKIAHLTNKGEV